MLDPKGPWWRYRGLGWPRSWQEVRFRDVAAWLIVSLGIWCQVDIGPRGRLVPGQFWTHRTDFTVFTTAAEALLEGGNPYEVASPRGWRYLYPPLFAILVTPLAVLDTETQVELWFAFNVTMAFACYFEARRLWRLIGGSEPSLARWIAICAGAAVMLPVLDCMQAGQLGIALLYFLMLGFRLVVSGRSRTRWFLGGVVLALPAVVKLIPAFPVLFLLCQRWSAVIRSARGRRPLGQASLATGGVAVGLLLFLLVVPSAFVGWNRNLDYLRIWQARVVLNQNVAATHNFNIHSYRNQSLANAVYLWNEAMGSSRGPGGPVGPSPGLMADPSVRVGCVVILALLAVAGWTIGARRRRLDQAAAFGLACHATLLLSPISWGHYYMAVLPALLCVPLWIARRGMPRLARGAALVPPIVSWCYYLSQGNAGSIGILGLGTTAWFLSVSGLIVVSLAAGARAPTRRAGRRSSLVPRPHVRIGRRRTGASCLAAGSTAQAAHPDQV